MGNINVLKYNTSGHHYSPGYGDGHGKGYGECCGTYHGYDDDE